MKPRFPLYTKILGWFFLNLLLLVTAGWWIISQQVRSGIDSFLSGYVGHRVEPVVRQMTVELGRTPRGDWQAVVDRFSKEHHVRFLLRGPGIEVPPADKADLPDEVIRRVPRGPPRRPQAGGVDDSDARPRESGKRPRAGFTEDDTLPGQAARDTPVHARFFLKAGEPETYWAGLVLAVPQEERGGALPLTVVMHSPTLTAGGFFLDFTPWILAAAALVLLSVLFWLPFVRGLTRSISQMSEATDRIADGDFDVRAEERRQDELGALGGAINRMSGRLHQYVRGQKRFLGDVAHELCSPLARLQMALGILEQRTDEKQRPYVDDLREEVQHMSDLVNELLSFSKASLRPADIQLEPVRVKEVAEFAVRREAAAGGEVEVIVPDNLVALAHRDLLQRAVGNLVRNALRYAGHAGPVSVTARAEEGKVRISVADHGPGIPEDQLRQVFDTFYRIDSSRARESGGVGLGLTIVRTCIASCGGTVRARNREKGGLRVIIELQPAVGE